MIWLLLAGLLIVAIAVFLSNRLRTLFVILILPFVAGLIALSIDWSSPLTPFSVLQLVALWLTSSTAVHFVRRRWEIRQGLHQWPNPQGRYYDEWLRLKSPHEDYYAWLARKMNW